MKVLLTHGYFMHEDEKEAKVNKPYPPLGLLYISAGLTKNNIENHVFDSTFSTREKLLKHIREHNYQFIGIYCNLMTKVNIVQIIHQIRDYDKKVTIVLGGPDIRYNVHSYLNAGAEILVVGEGEETMVEVVNSSPSEWNKIKGIAFKEADKVVQTEERKKIKVLDDIPLPDYEKIEIAEYLNRWKKWHHQSMMSVSTQRGCPYTCKWCSTAVYGQSYRRKSPSGVVEELKNLQKKYEVDAFWFVDDVFTVSHKWLEDFASEIKRSGLSISYECITRADRMQDRVVELLKESGCFRVWIGAESGSQKILDAMDRRVSVQQVREYIRKTREAGMEAGTFIMLGYPGERIEDIEETIDHLSESDPNHFTVTLAYPIKGTALFEETRGLTTEEHDWFRQSDRERNFKRTYKDRFYKHAIRKLVNEVKYRQSLKHGVFDLNRLKYKVKSEIAGIQMKLNR